MKPLNGKVGQDEGLLAVSILPHQAILSSLMSCDLSKLHWFLRTVKLFIQHVVRGGYWVPTSCSLTVNGGVASHALSLLCVRWKCDLAGQIGSMLRLLQMGPPKVLTTFLVPIQSSWQLSLLELPPAESL